MTVALNRLPERPADWDASIQRYESKTLFHESCWLDHILTIHPTATIEYFKITTDTGHVGYFCAVSLRKFLLRVFGSPLPGTGTNYMGPIVNRDVNLSDLTEAILTYCRSRGVAHLELAHDWYDPDQLMKHGLEIHRGVTHLCPLPQSEEEAWGRLKTTCRNRIRKAESNGLVAELTSDPRVVDHYFAQFQEVYGKQGMVTPFGIERPRSLFDSLMAHSRLMAIWVRHGDDVVATGLFPFDERCMYFWGAASWLKDQHLCPNELLHWTAMRSAVQRGVPLYNMCGGTSQFKDKFGGSDVPYHHYSKTFIPLLKRARSWYSAMHWQRLRLAAMFQGSARAR